MNVGQRGDRSAATRTATSTCAGALWHLASDAFGSVAVIIAGIGAWAVRRRQARPDRVDRSSRCSSCAARGSCSAKPPRYCSSRCPPTRIRPHVTRRVACRVRCRSGAPHAPLDDGQRSSRRCRRMSCSPANGRCTTRNCARASSKRMLDRHGSASSTPPSKSSATPASTTRRTRRPRWGRATLTVTNGAATRDAS